MNRRGRQMERTGRGRRHRYFQPSSIRQSNLGSDGEYDSSSYSEEETSRRSRSPSLSRSASSERDNCDLPSPYRNFSLSPHQPIPVDTITRLAASYLQPLCSADFRQLQTTYPFPVPRNTDQLDDFSDFSRSRSPVRIPRELIPSPASPYERQMTPNEPFMSDDTYYNARGPFPYFHIDSEYDSQNRDEADSRGRNAATRRIFDVEPIRSPSPDYCECIHDSPSPSATDISHDGFPRSRQVSGDNCYGDNCYAFEDFIESNSNNISPIGADVVIDNSSTSPPPDPVYGIVIDNTAMPVGGE